MAETATDLWRSVREEQFKDGVILNRKSGMYPAPGVLYPDFEERELSGGRIRAPDVVIKDGQVQKNGGTSLFDKDKVFKSKGWLSFRIPRGTVVDPLLVVRYTNHNERFSADHYQIEVEKPISVDAYKGALDNLARAAVKKAYEDAR